MATEVAFLDLARQHAELADALRQAFARAVETSGFIGGGEVAAFERDFAQVCGVQHCVGVANGTDALALALKVLGVGRGDVVVVPALTFIATAGAVTMLGATPRFVDIDPVTYTMSAAALAATDAGHVKAVVPVHLYGQAADMAGLGAVAARRGWRMVEDAAQAHGASLGGRAVGGLGDMAAFSFYPTKNLGAFGDAGAVVSQDSELVARLRRLADHGRLTRNEHVEPGINSRLDAIQAAVLNVKMRCLGDWNAARRRVAGWYAERLSGISGITLPQVGAGRTHVYHVYVVCVEERERLVAALQAAGIGYAIHYTRPLHLQPAYARLGYAAGDFPVAEQVARCSVSLPMYPHLSEAQVERVAAVVQAHARAGGG